MFSTNKSVTFIVVRPYIKLRGCYFPKSICSEYQWGDVEIIDLREVGLLLPVFDLQTTRCIVIITPHSTAWHFTGGRRWQMKNQVSVQAWNHFCVSVTRLQERSVNRFWQTRTSDISATSHWDSMKDMQKLSGEEVIGLFAGNWILSAVLSISIREQEMTSSALKSTCWLQVLQWFSSPASSDLWCGNQPRLL